MLCRICNLDSSTPLWPDLPAHRGRWHHCWACGSDFSEGDYAAIQPSYNADYVEHNLRAIGFEGCVREVQTNVWYFQKHEALAPDRTFLDIGCLEGSGLAAMAERGWSVHGFDVIPEAKSRHTNNGHITIAERFDANLFQRQYSAVMAREVIEHVPDWPDLLRQCFAATLPGGLCQIQTPRPGPECVGYLYFGDHLQLFSPFTLRDALRQAGFEIVDCKLWPEGQLWLGRKPAI